MLIKFLELKMFNMLTKTLKMFNMLTKTKLYRTYQQPQDSPKLTSEKEIEYFYFSLSENFIFKYNLIINYLNILFFLIIKNRYTI